MLHLSAAGRLGKDAQLRRTQGGDQVLSFSIGVDVRRGKEKATQWVNCSIWGDRAERVAQYMTKGTAVTVTGLFDLRSWEKDGKSGVSIECRVDHFTFQGGAKGEADDTGYSQPKREPGKAPVDLSDDIPF